MATSFSSLKLAESACAATVACSGVHDLGCKGFEYKLCSANYEPVAGVARGSNRGLLLKNGVYVGAEDNMSIMSTCVAAI